MAKKKNSNKIVDKVKSQPPIKILTFTPVWKREEIFKICLEGIKRLVFYDPSRFQIIPFFMVSESWAANMILNEGFDFILVQNNPLGNKKNMGLKYAMDKHEFDYLLEIGSDDIISNSYLDLIEPELRAETPQFCPSKVWFCDPSTGKTSFYKPETKIIGLGRGIHRSVLSKVHNYILWNPEAERGMDTFSWRHLLSTYKVENTMIQVNDIQLLDIKSKMNINSMDKFSISDISIDEVLKPFPEAEMVKAI